KKTEFDKNGDPVFSFLTGITNKYKDGQLPSEVDPSKLNIQVNPYKTYTLQIKILQFKEYLNTHPNKKEITRNDISEILDTCFIQIWSSSPSYHWQGYNYNNSVMDSAIYPTSIGLTSGPKGWKDRTTDMGFTDKHLTQLFMSIDFFKPQMAVSLMSACRQEGLF
ncbi:MAG: hypothetical protein WCO84_06375, partial [bacterium]